MRINSVLTDKSKFNNLYSRARALGYSVITAMNPSQFVICATPDALPIPYQTPLQTLTVAQLETVIDHINFYAGGLSRA